MEGEALELELVEKECRVPNERLIWESFQYLLRRIPSMDRDGDLLLVKKKKVLRQYLESKMKKLIIRNRPFPK